MNIEIAVKIMNILGGILLALPTIGGHKMASKVFGYIKRFLASASGISIILAILLYIAFIADVDAPVAYIYSLITGNSFEDQWILILVFMGKAILFLIVLSLILLLSTKAFEWAEAEDSRRKEREQRLGIIGIILIIIGALF